MNVQIIDVVLNVEQIVTWIPAQVERQHPLYMIDASREAAPFHREFLRSSDVRTFNPRIDGSDAISRLHIPQLK